MGTVLPIVFSLISLQAILCKYFFLDIQGFELFFFGPKYKNCRRQIILHNCLLVCVNLLFWQWVVLLCNFCFFITGTGW